MLIEFLFEFFPAWLNEYGSIRKDYGWYASIAIVDLHDELDRFVIALKPDIKIRDVVDFEEFFCA